MVQPFRYPRSINKNALREVVALKGRIEKEVVKAGELERNVKLGRGGIREIEFTVQALQLIHAGRQPFLQGAQTLTALQKLAQYELLSADDAQTLSRAYTFLREVEHRLQMEENRQTHTIPDNRHAQERLARLLSRARVHVDASDFQGFGRTGLEAMACGAVSVLTDVGGVQDYARDGENALLVPPSNPDATARAILRLLSTDSLHQQLRDKGIEVVVAPAIDLAHLAAGK